jgi:hypothetical protein
MRKFTRRAFLAGSAVLASLLAPIIGMARRKPPHPPHPTHSPKPSPSPSPTLIGLYTSDYQAAY